jgi:hypothetical protein
MINKLFRYLSDIHFIHKYELKRVQFVTETRNVEIYECKNCHKQIRKLIDHS